MTCGTYTPMINKVFTDLEAFFEENWEEIQQAIQEEQAQGVEQYVG